MSVTQRLRDQLAAHDRNAERMERELKLLRDAAALNRVTIARLRQELAEARGAVVDLPNELHFQKALNDTLRECQSPGLLWDRYRPKPKPKRRKRT